MEKSFKILGLKNDSISEDLSRAGSREQERRVIDNNNDRQQTIHD